MHRRLLFVALATTSTTVNAQAARDTIIVTGQRVPDALVTDGKPILLKDVPQGISIVSRELFEQQAPLSLTDILRNTPSVSNFRNSSETFRTVSIRGFTQFSTSIDGFRNTNALNIQPDGLANIERVEVIRGAAAALYGRGSLGAAVNIVTKKPDNTPAARLSINLGSRQFAGGTADLTGPIANGVSARLVAAVEHRDSFIAFTPIKSWQVAPSLAFGTGATRLLAQLDYRERKQLRYVGLPLYGTITGLNDIVLPIGLNLGEPSLPETINTGVQATVTLDHEFSENWSMQIAGRYNRNTYDQPVVGLRTIAADNRTLSRRYQRFVESEREYAAFAALNGQFTTGGIVHNIRIGAEYARFIYPSDFFSGGLAPINIASPVYGAQPTGIFLLDSVTDRISGTGISIQDQITVTERLKLLLAGRLDWIDTQRRSNVTNIVGTRSPSAFSPRVGATYDVVGGVTIYASWGRNIESQNNGGSNPALIPFEPVRGEQIEAGIKLSENERVAATLGVFRINASGVLTPNPSGVGSIQTGSRRSQGAEFEFNWQPVTGLALTGYVSYTDAEITFDTRLPTGTPIENVPKWQARLFAAYEVPNGPLAGFSINGSATHQGDQSGNLAALATRFTVPESTIIDAGIGYRTGPLQLRLQARNLFDQRHFIRGSFTSGFIIPGDPRTVVFSIGYNWGGASR